MKNNSILVIGSNGQLGKEFYRQSLLHNKKFLFYDYPEIDITIYESIEKILKNTKIDVIINCAAYTNVKLAEVEKKACSNVNDLGVKNLVKLSIKYNVKLIHFSTDYVYNSNSKDLINESERTEPINHYGFSKREGEKHIENSNCNSLVLRTSWLYSKFGDNFVNTIIKKAKVNTEIKVVNDEFGTPTYAKDLAEFTLKILFHNKQKLGKYKIYNFSNKGSTSWFEFAKEIIKTLDLKCKVVPVSSSEFQNSVKRPKFSVMDKSRIINEFNFDINDWKKSLEDYLKNDIND